MENPTIPCELCDVNVLFSEYVGHLELCQNRNAILNMLNPLLNNDIIDEYEMNIRISDMIGNVAQGVIDVEDAIKLINRCDLEEDTQCIICMELIKNLKNVNIVKTKCNHLFCEPCILRWMSEKSKCPLCLYNFNDNME
jgi:hypothetical protein